MSSCSENGWVRLKELESQQYLYLVVPDNSTQLNEWVVEVSGCDI